ncbi:MAG: thioredoxin family protein [Balneolaceae bacterium]|jgi:hypothetical protein|nr:MAG: thioredoxin family protein [Balneolaceae bacterium]
MTEVKVSFITRNIIENAYTYQEYRNLIDNLLKEGKTTGENHSESMLHYTKMSVHRMKRLDKRLELSGDLKNRLQNLDRHLTWLVLTEAWCGDAGQAVPVIQKMADESSKIQTRYILRNEHLELMDQFLTDGRSRSVPKVICLDSRTLDVLGAWGPRPEEAQQLHKDLRNRDDVSSREAAETLHKWYADDHTASIQKEFLSLLDQWEFAG